MHHCFSFFQGRLSRRGAVGTWLLLAHFQFHLGHRQSTARTQFSACTTTRPPSLTTEQTTFPLHLVVFQRQHHSAQTLTCRQQLNSTVWRWCSSSSPLVKARGTPPCAHSSSSVVTFKIKKINKMTWGAKVESAHILVCAFISFRGRTMP